MNKLLQKVAKLTLGLAMAAGVGVAVGAGRKDASPAHAAAGDSPVILDATTLSLTSTATTAEVTKTYGGVSYKVSSGAKSYSSSGSNRFSTNAAILIGKSDKYIYNSTALPGAITKFEIFANTGASTKVTVGVKFGTSAITSWNATGAWTATLSSVNTVYDASNKITSGDTYFRYQVTNANNSQVQIRITYASGPTKLETPTGLNYDSTNQQVKWNSVSNASGYKFSSDNGTSYSSTTTNLYYDVSSLTNGQKYTCKVYAVGDGSSYSDSDAASYEFTKTAPASYTSVTVEGGELDGTDKGAAFIQCSASATGTNLPNPITYTWYVTEGNTYGTTTSVTNKATIDSTGKVTFLDNCTVYVWALAPDGSTHNTSGYAAIASGLIDPKGSQTNPYTVTEAWNIAAGLGGTGSNIVNNGAVVFVTGTISTATASIETKTNGATFDITDGTKTLKAYSISGAQATDSTASGYVGYDYVVVVGGAIIDYKGTYEVGYASGYSSSLYSAVAPKSVSSIAVKTSPTKTTYDAGEYFAPAGLVITVTYSDTTTEDVAYSGNESKFTFTPTTSTALTTSNVSVTITYGGQSTSQAITVNAVPAVISVTVSPSSASVNIGATTSLSVTVEVEGGAAQTVSWSTSDGSVATVANGVVTGVASGTATITATSTVNNQKSGSATITVVDPTDTKIGTYALVKDVSLLGDGDWIVITNIDGTYGMGEQVSNSYRSQVAVTLTGSDIVISNTSNTSLKAAKLSVKNSHFEIKTDEGYLYANSGSSNNIGSRATNSDANGEWVFTINSSSGDATCIAQGTNSRKSLRYNAGNTRFSCYAETNSMADIHIYKKLPGTAAVSLTSNKEVLTSIGDTATLTAKAYSDSGKTKEIAGLTNTDFAFTSGDTNILTVSESGVVTAVASGETTITVSRDEYEDSVTIKVVYVTIDFINSGTSVEAGDEGTFTFTWSSNSLKPDTYDVEWSSNNDDAFVVSDDGSYLAGDAGETATITVTVIDEDLNEYVATKVFSTVSTVVAATHISVIESSGVTAYIGTNVNLSISVLGENDALATNQNVVCTSSDNNILTVTNAGVITPQSRGIATVTIIDEGELCEPVVINVRVRNAVLGDASVIGTFDFTGYTTTGKTMIDWYTEGTSAYSSAEFDGSGYQASDGGYIRFGSGSKTGGITVSYSSAIVKKVVVSAKLYGSDSQDCGIEGATSVGSFNASDFDTITYTFSTAVDEFTFTTNASSRRLYVESLTIYTAQADISSQTNPQALYGFEETNMHLDDYNSNLGYCKDTEHHYYSTAKAAFNALTKDQRDMYVSNEAFADGWARLSAWATANGESLNSSNQLAARPGISPLVNIIGENTNTVAIIVIISMVSVTAIGGYFFLRRRKENI